MDGAGALQAAQHYYPYGANRGAAHSDLTTWRYTGQRHEAALGLYDYNARWYDASIGRFIQADSIVPAPGNPQSLNRYAYVYNNPLRYTDPSGRYGRDVHYDLTHDLAEEIAQRILREQYGLSSVQVAPIAERLAEDIAKANQATDRFLSWDNSALPLKTNVHFLSYEEAQTLMERTLAHERPQPATIEEFGRSLHATQDAYRHRGQGYTVTSFGLLVDVPAMWKWVFDRRNLDYPFARERQIGHLEQTLCSYIGLTVAPDAPYGSFPFEHHDAEMRLTTIRYLERYISQYLAAQGHMRQWGDSGLIWR